MAIPIETVGRITNGSQVGRYLLVRDDGERTGDFLVFNSSAPDVFSADQVFDGWVEHHADLEQYFAEAGWNVEWQP